MSATFERNIKGKYKEKSAFISIHSGSDAYLLEDEVNELQWLQIEQRNQASQLLYHPGVVSTTSEPFTVQTGNNVITIAPLNVYYYGLNIYIPTQTLRIQTSNTPKTECLFIEVWFKLIPAVTTSVKAYGNQNSDNIFPVEITDTRISTATSQRVQVQTNYNYVTITGDSILNTQGTFGTIRTKDTLYVEETQDSTIVNQMCVVFPIAKLTRTNSYLTQAHITNIIEEPYSLIDNAKHKQDIENLQTQFEALLQRVNSISTEVIDDQAAYGLSMNKKIGIYTGYNSNMYNGTEVTIDNYANPNDGFVYGFTNLGNHYVGQIGEVWTYTDTKKVYICNSGCSNAVFSIFDFKDTNDELAYKHNINSLSSNQAKVIALSDLTNSSFLQDKKIKDTYVFIIPRYTKTNKPTSIPSIGDIYWNVNNITASNFETLTWGAANSIKIYNTGAANIPLSIFLMVIDHKNLLFKYLDLNASTEVNDRYGRHHHYVENNVTFGHTNVLVGTPFTFTPPVNNVGEIYIEQNDNMFMLNTTSYGVCKLPILIFKTAYTKGDI